MASFTSPPTYGNTANQYVPHVHVPVNLSTSHSLRRSSSFESQRVSVTILGENDQQSRQRIDVPFDTLRNNNDPLDDPLATQRVTGHAIQEEFDGRWRHDIFSCFGAVKKESFWIALCCLPLQISQLMTRMRLDWVGMVVDENQARRTPAGIFLVLFGGFLVSQFSNSAWPSLVLAGVMFYWATILRIRMKQHYGIEPANCISDCFISVFCTCCSSIQMIRHTHDESFYPYDLFAPDGLPINAPSVQPNTTVVILDSTNEEAGEISTVVAVPELT